MNWLKNIKEYIRNRPKTKKAIGVILILIGFVAFFIPLIPGSWLVIIGLELLGAQILLFDKPIHLYNRCMGKFKFWKKK